MKQKQKTYERLKREDELIKEIDKYHKKLKHKNKY
jgi:hypothetical protein